MQVADSIVDVLVSPSPFSLTELMISFFKTLTDQVITVELKNDLSITGTLKSVDQYVR
jgi:small nuclear ribonucleoprotein (snRNP)-like protein